MAGVKKRDFQNPAIENVALGLALRQFRLKKNRSQEQLAHDSGLDRTYISLLERGQRSPTFSTIVEICDGLDISLVAFIARAQELISELGAIGGSTNSSGSAQSLPQDSLDRKKGL